MGAQSKHEIMVLTLSTLAAIPVIGVIGFAFVTGIIVF